MEQELDPSIVPFPVLKSTKVLLPYPFAGDELFRGNSSTLKHLDFWIDENAVNVIYGGGALSKHRNLQVTISRVYYGIPNLPEGTMDLFLASLAGAARSLTLPASVVVKNIQVAVQGDYKFEHIQVFEATLDKLSLFSILCLLKALPALIELRCGISGLGSELEDISAKRLPDHIASTYGALGQNLRVWHIPSTNHDDDDNIIECIVLLALVCPNFRHANVAPCGIRNFNALVAKILRRSSFSKHALQLSRAFSTTYPTATAKKRTLLERVSLLIWG
ncbi:hypothetical protein GGH92_003623 [Coemansia sp. RSA 2673]|nr:hypothetical protein GGH92_003623 [Coemansia sp. RSA 2673]